MVRAAPTAVDEARLVRPRLVWRLVFIQVLLMGGFLYVSLLCLGGFLLMVGFDDQHSQAQRLMALAGGGLILLVSLWLLKVAMPRRLVPVLVERDRQ
ncbi:hypothetical protein C4Q28_10335 [Pseudomonas sp. SWI6]|uniref:Uncharacterized protein n=1 Tax=Pseudomonas taiwanensis TaxID=470150 RepID=A0ABR6V0Q7_9PSED|nr:MULTISPECIES: hypothetical protein [Pseudomonas]AGZ35972.1 hypothetical protein PVLB_15940 [Pseudomonas sp. VLB120]AVD82522.1 hypothetical protein C4Q28_10335 [Pseudomonas sp. SWI6]AVD89477.1 hypothetical protein C4Q26_21040 [Pseudomonas sp. SWI44]MBC3474075.1 hypothetical protein [Pseudomonas taiwanensis]MBC3491461.1 hypothetical protein [Pseudomonas taiwanensis]